MKNECYLHHNGFFIFEQRLSVFAFALSVILNLSLRSGFCNSATRKGKNEIIDDYRTLVLYIKYLHQEKVLKQNSDFLTTYIWITRIFL
jgi:hypothetical protein